MKLKTLCFALLLLCASVSFARSAPTLAFSDAELAPGGQPLAAIAGLAANGSHQVTLSCTPGTGGGTVTGFQFLRGTISGGPYANVGALQSSCGYVDVDPALTEGVTYYYVAKASGPGGQSAPSNQASALIPFLPPSSPTGLQATSQ